MQGLRMPKSSLPGLEDLGKSSSEQLSKSSLLLLFILTGGCFFTWGRTPTPLTLLTSLSLSRLAWLFRRRKRDLCCFKEAIFNERPRHASFHFHRPQFETTLEFQSSYLVYRPGNFLTDLLGVSHIQYVETKQNCSSSSSRVRAASAPGKNVLTGSERAPAAAAAARAPPFS